MFSKENAMHNKNHSSPNSKWSTVLGVVEFLIYYSIFDYIFLNIFSSNILGILKGFLCTMLLHFVIETVKEKWRSYFTGTVYGTILMESNSSSSVPLKNVEISWGPSHHLSRKDTPVITNKKGEFHFESLPLRPNNLTLTVDLTNNRYIHQDIGDFEGVRWFLGKRWLGFPLSSGMPKRVDFVIPDIPPPIFGN